MNISYLRAATSLILLPRKQTEIRHLQTDVHEHKTCLQKILLARMNSTLTSGTYYAYCLLTA